MVIRGRVGAASQPLAGGPRRAPLWGAGRGGRLQRCQICAAAVTVAPGRAATDQACFLQSSRWFCEPPCDTVMLMKWFLENP